MNTGLCIGINYLDTEHELSGCLNDANDWAAMLTDNGYTVTDLMEAGATRDAILGGIDNIVMALKPGDVGFITYSGHGTWVPDRENIEPDRRNEAICPIDMGDDGTNLILGPELKELFDKIPKGAHCVWVTDSCFSGHVYRLVFEAKAKRKVRFLPPAHFLKSAELKKRMDMSYGQPVNTKNQDPLAGLIHYSGCGDNEYSNDTEFDGRASGAFTYYALKAFRATLKKRSGSYLDAWKLIRKALPSYEYQQTPLLNAPRNLMRKDLLK